MPSRRNGCQSWTVIATIDSVVLNLYAPPSRAGRPNKSSAASGSSIEQIEPERGQRQRRGGEVDAKFAVALNDVEALGPEQVFNRIQDRQRATQCGVQDIEPERRSHADIFVQERYLVVEDPPVAEDRQRRRAANFEAERIELQYVGDHRRIGEDDLALDHHVAAARCR